MTLFIFYFYNTSGIFNSTFYRQQFLNNLKDIFVSNFYSTFASNFILVFSHHHLATHTYSQRIAFGCQEQIVYQIWSMSYLAALNMLSRTLPLPNFTLVLMSILSWEFCGSWKQTFLKDDSVKLNIHFSSRLHTIYVLTQVCKFNHFLRAFSFLKKYLIHYPTSKQWNRRWKRLISHLVMQ